MDGLQPGDGQRLLDASLAGGLFLVSLDDEQRWYRFHHLFRDMLRRRLERDAGPERVQALRRRASDWLAGQGLWDEAATQAIDANDIERVTSLVETCLMTERSIGTSLMLESWTRRLPPDVVDDEPHAHAGALRDARPSEANWERSSRCCVRLKQCSPTSRGG